MKEISTSKPKPRPSLRNEAWLILALSFCASVAAAVPRAGLTVLRTAGATVAAGVSGTARPLETGYDLVKGDRLALSLGGLVEMRLADRVDLALAGPALFSVTELKRDPLDPEKGWRAVLKLEQGCLWADPRPLLERPLEFVL